MEKTIENKEKFFALYWGQYIREWTVNVNSISAKVGNTYMTKKIIKHCHLELTPLSQISDEDALQVSKILDANFDENTLSDSARTFHVNRGKGHVLPSRPCRSDVCDYLRSKGYALPYMGLSVEKLVEYGWVELKTE